MCIECPVSIVLIETKAVNHFDMLKMGVKINLYVGFEIPEVAKAK